MLVWQFFSYDSLSHWLSLLQRGPFLRLSILVCPLSLSLCLSLSVFVTLLSLYSICSFLVQPVYPSLSSSIALLLLLLYFFFFPFQPLLYPTSSLFHSLYIHTLLSLFLPPSLWIPPPPPSPTSSSSPTPSNSEMKGCKHVFHMRSHCAEPTEQNNHA